MKLLVLVLVTNVLCCCDITAHPDFNFGKPKIYLNLGYRIGSMKGLYKGEVSGFEFSITYFDRNTDMYYGVVVNTDTTPSGRRSTVGIQVSNKYVGGSIGSSFFSSTDKSFTALTATVYSGILIYPSYSLTIGSNSFFTHELSAALKVPIPVINYPED